MEAVCSVGDSVCARAALTTVLHALHIYCCALAATLVCCSGSPLRDTPKRRWRWDNARGIASLALGACWTCSASTAVMRRSAHVQLIAALISPLAWLVSCWLHCWLWSKQTAAPLLYLVLYGLLSATADAFAIIHIIQTGANVTAVVLYMHACSLFLTTTIAIIDSICFYDGITKRFKQDKTKQSKTLPCVSYKHNDAYFYSKITFFWLNSLLRKGYDNPLEEEDLGELRFYEKSVKHYHKLIKIWDKYKAHYEKEERSPCLWIFCAKMIWPNFYIGGILKLFGDLLGLVPPLGLAMLMQYISGSDSAKDLNSPVTMDEFLHNGYVMLLIIFICLITQALLSQNSTHLVTVEGIRLKTALQGILFDKCTRLSASDIHDESVGEKVPLLRSSQETVSSNSSQNGLITNLVAQDTYNVMSSIWICHYIWAIPIKVSVIIFLLYTKLGTSAVIGSVISILFITPLQFYIGKKISDNSKEISKCSDHRISKMTEILNGMNVIKLYVWEDLFKEKILYLREVELKLLNKESVYWSFLTFSMQASSILVTVITFFVYYFLEDGSKLTAVNVFTSLALFNQLAIPLLILPVTVLIVIQAMVSSARIRDFILLPESNSEEDFKNSNKQRRKMEKKFNKAFCGKPTTDKSDSSEINTDDDENENTNDELDEIVDEFIIKIKNAIFTWDTKVEVSYNLEVDDLEIPVGKLLMVVGGTGAGKSSVLSAVLGEMNLDRGNITWARDRRPSCAYAGQTPWIIEASIKDNIILTEDWCPSRYARVLRATDLRPDLQLLPDGDGTRLSMHGTPLSGGQVARVCVARALYSRAPVIVLDEPLGALDPALARLVVARGLIPATRDRRTVLVATNRFDLIHYADIVILVEEGRVVYAGGPRKAIYHWPHLASGRLATSATSDCTMRERSRLLRELTRTKLRQQTDERAVGVCEVTGAHLLTEVPACAPGSWRRVSSSRRARPTLLQRQFSTPPVRAFTNSTKYRREVRRTVSADASSSDLRREASLLRRLMRRPQTVARPTPRPLRRLLTMDLEAVRNQNNDKFHEAMLETEGNGITTKEPNKIVLENDRPPLNDEQSKDLTDSEYSTWWIYTRACGWWSAIYLCAAISAQILAVAADWWLAHWTALNRKESLDSDQMWKSVVAYLWWCSGSLLCAAGAQGACACAGAAARRTIHERLLHSTLHAPRSYHDSTTASHTLHRFSSDVLVLDKKLPTAVSRWGQLALLCASAVLVNAVISPWSVLLAVPMTGIYLMLQTVYRRNAREFQRIEAGGAARVAALCGEVFSGANVVRAGHLQKRMRDNMMARLDIDHAALLLLHSTNRWLGFALDIVGACAVCISLAIAQTVGADAELAGLVGAYSLILPTYLAHLAKCRADLDLHMDAVERVQTDTSILQEDYRDHCAVSTGWPKNGEISFHHVTARHTTAGPPTISDITICIASGEKVAVCGRSGSGKSTLLSACAGCLCVSGGRVLAGGSDVREIPLRKLRHRLVSMPQHAAGVFFAGTLRENLDPLAVHTDEEILQALQTVGLREFVTAQHSGLECSIGRGSGWSAGRACRLAAARAVLRAPHAAALLLDEPGAALDATAERDLLNSIAVAASNATILTVAHRVSSVVSYDRVLVMEHGRIVEQGPPVVLLADPASRFARMRVASAERVRPP